jgi:hypothetical protein
MSLLLLLLFSEIQFTTNEFQIPTKEEAQQHCEKYEGELEAYWSVRGTYEITHYTCSSVDGMSDLELTKEKKNED